MEGASTILSTLRDMHAEVCWQSDWDIYGVLVGFDVYDISWLVSVPLDEVETVYNSNDYDIYHSQPMRPQKFIDSRPRLSLFMVSSCLSGG
jgi:hypothetical protein